MRWSRRRRGMPSAPSSPLRSSRTRRPSERSCSSTSAAPNVRRLEDLLDWICLSGTDVAVTHTEDDEITAERPETVEKFRSIFKETGLRSFFGVVLKDEEGKLGALGFESVEPLVVDE